MTVYDTANRLATEIKESAEYTEYKKLKDSINSNAEKKQKIEDFEKLRYNIQLKAMQGQNADEEIKKYFDAEVRFNVLIGDVNKIIAEAVREVL